MLRKVLKRTWSLWKDRTECPLVHSFCYPFDIEETWWLFLIWEFEPPNRKGSVEQKLLMYKKITGQDRIDSIKIYRDIKALQDELDVLMEEKEKKENENAGTSKDSADDTDGNNLRNRSKAKEGKNEQLSEVDKSVFGEKEDDEGILSTVDPIFELQEQIVELRKKLKTSNFKLGHP